MSTSFDAVVVGSGAGGSPLACLLCEAGWKVLLVERGRAYQKSDFDRDEIEWCRRDRFVPSPKTDPHTRRSSIRQLPEGRVVRCNVREEEQAGQHQSASRRRIQHARRSG